MTAFDTHAAVETLTNAGASKALAEAVVCVVQRDRNDAARQLVTEKHLELALTKLTLSLVLRLVVAGITIACAFVTAALQLLDDS